MKFFNFTKTPKHRVFNYVPRYYDPKEDERNAIIRRAKIEAGLIEEKDMDSDVDRAKHRISRSFQTRVISSHYKKKSQRSSNLRIVLIIIILATLTYILLNFNLSFLVDLLE